MTPADLSRTVLRAVRHAVAEGELSVPVPERIVVERPRPGGSGDYATNVALQLAGPAGSTPREVARLLTAALVREPGIAAVEITGPGFLSITLEGDQQVSLVRDVLSRGESYGHTESLASERIELRIPDETRARLVAEAVARIAATQGATTEITHAEPANLRPVPADIEGLGPDATRWALLHPAPHDHPRLTKDHLVQRETNPLFRVRYAHARTRALGRNAADLGFAATPGDVGDVQEAANLLAALADHPRVLEAAARHRAPDRLARHLVATADAFLAFQGAVLPLGDEKPEAAHRARLALAEAAGTVLAGGLSLLGITAPDYL
ncbi:ArgS-related anticodon-binding protein NrtL [Streptomyces sp. NBC_01304]|uniref:ArgS-related anticodon-binding protein NrtL n=1 Tax=Streptomyces sp. NBC_01304 TaxID=2903818 RepID=UPI002E0F0F53|nr:DALR anticodon-binding domain-containing protein [Streptomyces sp. NBC_01304]